MKHLTRKGVVMAMLPPVAGLFLFYSLAGHMYLSLGRWPGFGESGFSRALSLHATIQTWWTGIVLLLGIYLWPVVLVVCAGVPKVRWLIVYLTIFSLSALVCLALGMLAPKPFLNWWCD